MISDQLSTTTTTTKTFLPHVSPSECFWNCFGSMRERQANKNNNIIRQRSAKKAHYVTSYGAFNTIREIWIISFQHVWHVKNEIQWGDKNLSEMKHWSTNKKRRHHYSLCSPPLLNTIVCNGDKQNSRSTSSKNQLFVFTEIVYGDKMSKSPPHSAPYRNWILFCCVKPGCQW